MRSFIMIKYDRLWETLARKGITKYKLHTYHKISKSQLHRLQYNQSVNTNTIDRICNILQCDVSDVMEHFPDDNVF